MMFIRWNIVRKLFWSTLRNHIQRQHEYTWNFKFLEAVYHIVHIDDLQYFKQKNNFS